MGPSLVGRGRCYLNSKINGPKVGEHAVFYSDSFLFTCECRDAHASVSKICTRKRHRSRSYQGTHTRTYQHTPLHTTIEQRFKYDWITLNEPMSLIHTGNDPYVRLKRLKCVRLCRHSMRYMGARKSTNHRTYALNDLENA